MVKITRPFQFVHPVYWEMYGPANIPSILTMKGKAIVYSPGGAGAGHLRYPIHVIDGKKLVDMQIESVVDKTDTDILPWLLQPMHKETLVLLTELCRRFVSEKFI
jgi:hypothetical protein